MIIHTLYTTTDGKNLGEKWISKMEEKHIVKKDDRIASPPLVYSRGAKEFLELDFVSWNSDVIKRGEFIKIWEKTGFMRQIILIFRRKESMNHEEYLELSKAAMDWFEHITGKDNVYDVYVWHSGKYPHIHIFQVSSQPTILYFKKEHLYYLRAISAVMFDDFPSLQDEISKIRNSKNNAKDDYIYNISLSDVKSYYKGAIDDINKELLKIGIEEKKHLIKL